MFVLLMFCFSLSAGCCCCLVCYIWDSTAASFTEQVKLFDILRHLSVDCCCCCFLLNTFTTSDTTSMSATLTFNRISVKSVKRKREAVLGCECFEWRLFIGGLLVNNPWKVVLDEFHANIVSDTLESFTKQMSRMFCQFDSCHFDGWRIAFAWKITKLFNFCQ